LDLWLYGILAFQRERAKISKSPCIYEDIHI
jgi:hypothetical protein